MNLIQKIVIAVTKKSARILRLKMQSKNCCINRKSGPNFVYWIGALRRRPCV